MICSLKNAIFNVRWGGFFFFFYNMLNVFFAKCVRTHNLLVLFRWRVVLYCFDQNYLLSFFFFFSYDGVFCQSFSHLKLCLKFVRNIEQTCFLVPLKYWVTHDSNSVDFLLTTEGHSHFKKRIFFLVSILR